MSNLQIKITLACDQSNNVIATLEELFHAYQLQQGCLQESWLKGDREFEAKVYDILVMSQTDFTSGLFDDIKMRNVIFSDCKRDKNTCCDEYRPIDHGKYYTYNDFDY